MLPQTTLTTPNAQADLWDLLRTNSTLLQTELATETDAMDIGKGDEFPTTVFKTSMSTALEFQKYATSEYMAWLFAFALGSCTKAAAGTGFTYASIPQDPTVACINLPPFTYVEQIRPEPDSVVDRAAVGLVVNDFQLAMQSGPGRANCQVTAHYLGTGMLVNPSGMTMPVPTSEHLLNAAGATTLTINGIDYLMGTGAGRFNSLQFGWNNNVRTDSGYYPGSGLQNGFAMRGRMEFGTREATLSFVARAVLGSVEYNNLLNLTEGATTITVQGAVIGAGPETHGMTISCPRTIISAENNGDADGIVTVNCTVQVLKPTGGGPLCTLSSTTATDKIFGL
jgi:hypothetical protein